MTHIIHKELSFIINGILFEVHNELGKFSSEKQICDLIELKLKERDLKYLRENNLLSEHEGEKPGRHRVDFLIDNKIILEIKYPKYLLKDDYDQTRRYLATLNLALGILVNFREDRLHPRRVLNGAGKE